MDGCLPHWLQKEQQIHPKTEFAPGQLLKAKVSAPKISCDQRLIWVLVIGCEKLTPRLTALLTLYPEKNTICM